MQTKNRLKRILSPILEYGYRMLEGTGIGKILPISNLWLKMNSFLYDGWIEIDSQKIYVKTEITGVNTAKQLNKNIFEPHVTSLFCNMIKN